MANDLARYQGLATAAADLLCEVTPDGRVSFVSGIGANPGITPGTSLYDPFVKDARDLISALLAGTNSVRRGGPLTVMLQSPIEGRRIATVSTFRHKEIAPALCCAINFYEQAPGVMTVDAEGFVAGATARQDAPTAVSMIEVAQLSSAMRGMSGPAAAELVGNVEGVLAGNATSSHSVSCLGGDRYAVVHALGAEAGILDQIRAAGARCGATLNPVAETIEMPEDDPMVVACALRSTLDRFISGGLPTDGGSLQQHFERSVGDTRARVQDFMEIVREQKVKLHFQPIVDLKTGEVHHHEVLARFGQARDTEQMIRTAEDLRLITRFDITVAERAVARLKQDAANGLKLAINVSAKSLETDNYMVALLAFTAVAPDIRARLFLEVTETAALTDLTPVAQRIGQLRDAGFKIYIDDFGAGSASFDYIRAFPVDAVKIDGKFVRGAMGDARSVMMIRHIVQLCNSLGLDTVAEQVETEEVAALLTDCGVRYGQGWYWGKAEAQPLMSVKKSEAAAAA